MTREEMKRAIKEKGIDRRVLAEKVLVTPFYLNQILNGWAPLKQDKQEIIERELGQI